MNYHNITYDDMLNGPGLRIVLWVSGCEHRCAHCHNPETWGITSGVPFDEDAKKELFDALKPDYIDGLTLSGGDPLHPRNIDEITLLVKEVSDKFPDKTIWIYTGYLYEDISELEILKYIDVLVDGRYINKLQSPNTPWVGSSNQQIIDIGKTIDGKEIFLYTE